MSLEKKLHLEVKMFWNLIDSFFLVSLENVQIDVQDLTRGLDNAKKELVIRQTLKVFFSSEYLIEIKKSFFFGIF